MNGNVSSGRARWPDLCGAMCLLMNLTPSEKRTPPVSRGRSFRTNVAYGSPRVESKRRIVAEGGLSTISTGNRKAPRRCTAQKNNSLACDHFRSGQTYENQFDWRVFPTNWLQITRDDRRVSCRELSWLAPISAISGGCPLRGRVARTRLRAH